MTEPRYRLVKFLCIIFYIATCVFSAYTIIKLFTSYTGGCIGCRQFIALLAILLGCFIVLFLTDNRKPKSKKNLKPDTECN